MKNITVFTIIVLSFAIGLAAACSSGSNMTTNTINGNQAKTTNAPNSVPAPKTDEDVPASVKAAFPDAQSFSKQHKDLTKDQIADIEKDAGAKVPDTDHHSYLAFSTTGGARKQIGAATIVKPGGKEVVIVYESKNGSPVIKEVRAEGISLEFLKQFAGKGHDDIFSVGNDIKVTGGVDEATAKAIAQTVRIDSMTMQTLYGSAHSH